MSDSWWPDGAEDPAFTVQRQPYGQILGGDYVRARSGGITTLPQTAVRFMSQVKGWDAIADRALVAIRPYNYDTMEVSWGWPKSLGDTWLEVAVVRSSFGRPITPNDGQTVFMATREQLLIDYSPDGVNIFAPLVYDRPLRNGYWYYYTIFFKTTPVDWVRGMSMGSPLPRNYGHSDHLWNHTPPWYQYQDDNMRADDGFLKQFYRIFGFELDLEREYVEQWQKLYHIDYTPRRLLIHLGRNFDIPFEPGLGDIRYRGLVGSVAKLYNERGTRRGLRDLIQAASQYECDITPGDNIFLTPDDSEFRLSTGNWSAFHSDLPFMDSNYNNFTNTIINVTSEEGPPANQGRGVMKVEAHKTGSTGGALGYLGICSGAGIVTVAGPPNPDGTYSVVEKEVIPLYGGISVVQGTLYGFTIWIKEPVPDETVVGLMWFGPGGQIDDYLGSVESDPVTPSDTEWWQYTIQAIPPVGDSEADPPIPDGAYLVPYIKLKDTAFDRPFYVAGALGYGLGGTGVVAAFAPDMYLTLGDPGELIGTLKDSGGGFLMGNPAEKK